MGGAGVAVTGGALSTYWNPAGLGPPRPHRLESFAEIGLSASATGTATEDVLGELDDVVELVDALDVEALQDALRAGRPLSATELRQLLRIVEQLPDLDSRGSGLSAAANAALNLKLWRFGFTAAGLFYGGGATVLDRTTLALGTNGLDAVIAAGPNRPATAQGQALAQRLVEAGLLDAARANELVFQAEQAGVNVGSREFQRLLTGALEATADNQGGSEADVFTSNESGVILRALVLQEYSFGYGQPLSDFFDFEPLSWVSVGIALKALYGTTFSNPFRLADLDDFEDVFDEVTADANEAESFSVGVDVGILVEPTSWLALGLVGRNLNRPAFDLAGPGKYELDPQLRAGLGIELSDSLLLAVDLDVLKNQSDALRGRESQVLGAGIEYSVLDWDVLFLRAGVSKNLADEKEDLVVHAGLGLALWGFSIDAAGLVATDFTEVSSDTGGHRQELPERLGLALFIGLRVPLE